MINALRESLFFSIFVFMSSSNSMLISVEHEKSFITSVSVLLVQHDISYCSLLHLSVSSENMNIYYQLSS